MFKYLSHMAKCLAFACVIAIVHQSLQPGSGFPPTSHTDKLYHAGAYGILAVWTVLGWPFGRSLYIFLGLTLLGGTVELAQGVMDIGRTASWLDALANAVGIGCVLIIRQVIRRLFLK